METVIYKPDHDLFRVVGSSKTNRIEFVITRGTVEHFQQLEYDEAKDFHSALGYWLQEQVVGSSSASIDQLIEDYPEVIDPEFSHTPSSKEESDK